MDENAKPLTILISNEPLYYPSFQSRQENYQNLHHQNVSFLVHGQPYLLRGCLKQMSLDVDNEPQDGADVDEKNVRSKIVRLTKLNDLVLGCIKIVFPCSIFGKSDFQFL